MTYGEYLKTGHFSEATAENWESEFLQMFVYVVATTFLFLGAFWWHAVGGLRLANEERLQDGETAITLAPEGRGGAFIVCCVIIMKSEPEFHGRGASFTGRTCSLNVSDYFVFFQEGRTFIPPDAAGCGR